MRVPILHCYRYSGNGEEIHDIPEHTGLKDVLSKEIYGGNLCLKKKLVRK